jgi:glutamine cyclotransferase
MKYPIAALLVLVSLSACNNNNPDTEKAPVVENNVPATMSYTITNVYPHNTKSYTEGLEWHDSTLYESTGLAGESRLARVSLQTGSDIKKVELDKKEFGEGITVLNGKLYQLTYEHGKCFVYDFKTFKKIGEFDYEGEGWGMTNDGKHLIMNNGSNNLYYRDPETFKVVKTLGVYDDKGAVEKINELEFVNGAIYSNIWLTNYIIKIDTATGKVIGKADFSYVLNRYAPGAISDDSQATNEVLNGIAYDSAGKRFFITGKHWPKLFEVKFN